MENNQLAHAGIKGMRWGIRRYQNKDGSYTPAGKRRRRRQDVEEAHEDYTKAHTGKSVKSMSTQELKAVNNRLQMEQQYANLTTKKKSAGRKFVTGVLVAAGTAVATQYATKYLKAGAEYAERKGAAVATAALIRTSKIKGA